MNQAEWSAEIYHKMTLKALNVLNVILLET